MGMPVTCCGVAARTPLTSHNGTATPAGKAWPTVNPVPEVHSEAGDDALPQEPETDPKALVAPDLDCDRISAFGLNKWRDPSWMLGELRLVKRQFLEILCKPKPRASPQAHVKLLVKQLVKREVHPKALQPGGLHPPEALHHQNPSTLP